MHAVQPPAPAHLDGDSVGVTVTGSSLVRTYHTWKGNNVLITLLLTSGRDPGILPRNAYPPVPDGYDGSVNIKNELKPLQHLLPTKEVIVNGISAKRNYCDTCKPYRPPRCFNCPLCDNCVKLFNHHCPWLGQCIGLTIYENYSRKYDGHINPYDKKIFCHAIPPSKNNSGPRFLFQRKHQIHLKKRVLIP